MRHFGYVLVATHFRRKKDIEAIRILTMSRCVGKEAQSCRSWYRLTICHSIPGCLSPRNCSNNRATNLVALSQADPTAQQKVFAAEARQVPAGAAGDSLAGYWLELSNMPPIALSLEEEGWVRVYDAQGKSRNADRQAQGERALYDDPRQPGAAPISG
jgi:hypothetical protein